MQHYLCTAPKTLIVKILFLLLVSLLALRGTVSLAQTGSDTIQIRKSGDGSTRFVLNGKRLTPRRLSAATRSNPATHAEMKIARSNHAMGSILSFAGGFLTGYQLGTLIRGGQPNWVVAGVGVGLIGLSLPLSSGYTKHAKKAVRIYNAGLRATHVPRVDVRAGFACNQVRLGVTF
jgi:hypothetical protein